MKNTNFKNGQAVEFSGEKYTFIKTFKYQDTIFAIIRNATSEEFQPIEFIKGGV